MSRRPSGCKLGYRQRTEGFLAGVDFGRPELFSRFDSIVLSVMGGYISSFLDFNSPNALFGPPATTSFKYTGGTFGASLTYMNRGLEDIKHGVDVAGNPSREKELSRYEKLRLRDLFRHISSFSRRRQRSGDD
jgi:hypothetical protein